MNGFERCTWMHMIVLVELARDERPRNRVCEKGMRVERHSHYPESPTVRSPLDYDRQAQPKPIQPNSCAERAVNVHHPITSYKCLRPSPIYTSNLEPENTCNKNGSTSVRLARKCSFISLVLDFCDKSPKPLPAALCAKMMPNHATMT